MSKTTLDLSTLSDISDGTHTVKVKAKADGYRDSEFSNEVSWTKSSVKSIHITKLFVSNNKVKDTGFTSTYNIKFDGQASGSNYDLKVIMSRYKIIVILFGVQTDYTVGYHEIPVDITVSNNVSIRGTQTGTDSMTDIYFTGTSVPTRYNSDETINVNYVITDSLDNATLNIIQTTS